MGLVNLKIWISVFILTIVPYFLKAQVENQIYFVQFTDKDELSYSINDPIHFLSTKAVNRRLRSDIQINFNDLPVNQDYVNQVKEAGASIKFITKWMNGVGITPNDLQALDQLTSLPFVREIILIQSNPASSWQSQIDFLKRNEICNETIDGSELKLKSNIVNNESLDYGLSENQIKMLNGDVLHQQGFQGEGITIAVIDNGFLNANQISAFDSLWRLNRVLSTKDFVKNSEVQFDEGSHGTKVLSIMAANSPGLLIGTAPKANYHLIRTEIEGSESLLEEYLWMCGAEYADSAGADIINSSLGYTVFDNESQDHSYSDMDGNTTIVTRAADIAASKGILVVNSAGNYANKSWQFVGAPADGDSVLAVGAVDENGLWAEFSSLGPTVDGRIKPDIVAQGKNTAFLQTNGNAELGNGTSFSSPIIAGLAACLWQSNITLNNIQILESIVKSSNRASSPNVYYGSGIPDFNLAMQFAQELIVPDSDNKFIKAVYPNPFRDNIKLLFVSERAESVQISIIDVSGKIALMQTMNIYQGLNYIHLTNLKFIPAGIYIIRLKSSTKNLYQIIIKIG